MPPMVIGAVTLIVPVAGVLLKPTWLFTGRPGSVPLQFAVLLKSASPFPFVQVAATGTADAIDGIASHTAPARIATDVPRPETVRTSIPSPLAHFPAQIRREIEIYSPI